MKKKWVILFLLALSVSLKAQLVKDAGFTAGLAIFSQDWQPKEITGIEYSKSSLPGLNYSLFAEFINSDLINIRISGGYVSKGVDELFNGTVAVAEYVGYYSTKVNYLYTSAFLKLQLPMGTIRPYIMVGPRLDFQVSFKTDKDIENILVENTKTIYGYDVGGGIEIYFDYFGINIEIT